MGNFKQHVTCSTITGIVLGGAGYYLGVPLPTCVLSAGLCSMAGMLPDIDSDTSRSFQECIYLAAGIAAVLTVQRLRISEQNFSSDIVLLGGAFMFLFVRFGVGEIVKKITSHRGMFHSIPAAVFAGEIVFFLSTGTVNERIFKAAALTIGYLSHLILDEVCSIDSSGRLKKSSGTALKFSDPKRIPATLALYTLVISMGIVAVNDPEIDRTTIKQYASEKLKSKTGGEMNKIISEVANGLEKELPTEILTDIKTDIKREAAEYLAQTKAKTFPAVSELKPLVAVNNDRNSEERLFSRNRRRASPIPVAETETDIAPVKIASYPAPTPIPLPPQPQYDSPSPMQIQADSFVESRNSYRHFAIPNREPAPAVLP